MHGRDRDGVFSRRRGVEYLAREREGRKNVCQERDGGGDRDTGVRAGTKPPFLTLPAPSFQNCLNSNTNWATCALGDDICIATDGTSNGKSALPRTSEYHALAQTPQSLKPQTTSPDHHALPKAHIARVDAVAM